MTEPQILAAVLESTRQLTHFYLDELKDVDKMKRFKIGDFQTNNVHWIVAHLAWSENALVLRGVCNEGIDISWFELFRLGAPNPPISEYPPFDETINALNQVHQATMSLLSSLPPEALDQSNNFGRKIMGQDSKRILIHHCIRHEGVHCGHLGWLARLHGLKVI